MGAVSDIVYTPGSRPTYTPTQSNSSGGGSSSGGSSSSSAVTTTTTDRSGNTTTTTTNQYGQVRTETRDASGRVIETSNYNVNQPQYKVGGTYNTTSPAGTTSGGTSTSIGGSDYMVEIKPTPQPTMKEIVEQARAKNVDNATIVQYLGFGGLNQEQINAQKQAEIDRKNVWKADLGTSEIAGQAFAQRYSTPSIIAGATLKSPEQIQTPELIQPGYLPPTLEKPLMAPTQTPPFQFNTGLKEVNAAVAKEAYRDVTGAKPVTYDYDAATLKLLKETFPSNKPQSVSDVLLGPSLLGPNMVGENILQGSYVTDIRAGGRYVINSVEKSVPLIAKSLYAFGSDLPTELKNMYYYGYDPFAKTQTYEGKPALPETEYEKFAKTVTPTQREQLRTTQYVAVGTLAAPTLIGVGEPIAAAVAKSTTGQLAGTALAGYQLLTSAKGFVVEPSVGKASNILVDTFFVYDSANSALKAGVDFIGDLTRPTISKGATTVESAIAFKSVEPLTTELSGQRVMDILGNEKTAFDYGNIVAVEKKIVGYTPYEYKFPSGEIVKQNLIEQQLQEALTLQKAEITTAGGVNEGRAIGNVELISPVLTSKAEPLLAETFATGAVEYNTPVEFLTPKQFFEQEKIGAAVNQQASAAKGKVEGLLFAGRREAEIEAVSSSLVTGKTPKVYFQEPAGVSIQITTEDLTKQAGKVSAKQLTGKTFSETFFDVSSGKVEDVIQVPSRAKELRSSFLIEDKEGLVKYESPPETKYKPFLKTVTEGRGAFVQTGEKTGVTKFSLLDYTENLETGAKTVTPRIGIQKAEVVGDIAEDVTAQYETTIRGKKSKIGDVEFEGTYEQGKFHERVKKPSTEKVIVNVESTSFELGKPEARLSTVKSTYEDIGGQSKVLRVETPPSYITVGGKGEPIVSTETEIGTYSTKPTNIAEGEGQTVRQLTGPEEPPVKYAANVEVVKPTGTAEGLQLEYGGAERKAYDYPLLEDLTMKERKTAFAEFLSKRSEKVTRGMLESETGKLVSSTIDEELTQQAARVRAPAKPKPQEFDVGKVIDEELQRQTPVRKPTVYFEDISDELLIKPRQKTPMLSTQYTETLIEEGLGDLFNDEPIKVVAGARGRSLQRALEESKKLDNLLAEDLIARGKIKKPINVLKDVEKTEAQLEAERVARNKENLKRAEAMVEEEKARGKIYETNYVPPETNAKTQSYDFAGVEFAEASADEVPFVEGANQYTQALNKPFISFPGFVSEAGEVPTIARAAEYEPSVLSRIPRLPTQTSNFLEGATVRILKPVRKSSQVNLSKLGLTSGEKVKSVSIQDMATKYRESLKANSESKLATDPLMKTGVSNILKSESGLKQGLTQDVGLKTDQLLKTKLDIVQVPKPNITPVPPFGVETPFNKPTNKPSLILLTNRDELGLNVAYNVYVKEKGKLIKVNRKPQTKMDALDLGAYYTDNTPARTFKVVPVKDKPAEPETSYMFSPERYSAGKKNKDLYIEKSKYAISSKGEKEGITVKGLKARQSKMMANRFSLR